MPAVDSTYLIGVIREWEKTFLEDDEYTRLIEADGEAPAALRDTPYGSGLDKHLQDIHTWIGDMSDDTRVWQFISARYDGLNAAAVLIDKMEGRAEPGLLSDLGTIEADLWQAVIWNNLGWDKMPADWAEFAKAWQDQEVKKTELLKQVEAAELKLMRKLAFTPLMKDVVEWRTAKQAADRAQRPLVAGGEQPAAGAYEKEWDEKLMEIIRERRLEPVGHDTVMAFWYGKELETKQVRQILAAKAVQLPKEEIRERQVSLYRAL